MCSKNFFRILKSDRFCHPTLCSTLKLMTNRELIISRKKFRKFEIPQSTTCRKIFSKTNMQVQKLFDEIFEMKLPLDKCFYEAVTAYCYIQSVIFET